MLLKALDNRWNKYITSSHQVQRAPCKIPWSARREWQRMISLYSARWGLSCCFLASQRRERLEMPASLWVSLCVRASVQSSIYYNWMCLSPAVQYKSLRGSCKWKVLYKALMEAIHQAACGGSTCPTVTLAAVTIHLFIHYNSLFLPLCFYRLYFLMLYIHPPLSILSSFHSPL